MKSEAPTETHTGARSGTVPQLGIKYSEFDFNVMVKTVYGEARGEGYQGMVAVAWTILNRAKRPGWWGEGISGVCLENYQFSCWNMNDPNYKLIRPADIDEHRFFEARRVVRDVLYGRAGDPTGGSDHYHADHMRPYWAEDYRPVTKINNHLFYKIGLYGDGS